MQIGNDVVHRMYFAPTPGSSGVAEGAFILLFSSDVGKGDLVSLTFVWRLFTMTEALSTFFRYSISNRNNIVTLEEELENVRNYFMIQQFRFNNRFRLQILPVPQELLNNCRLPKLTLQPILENTILHGMEEKLGPGTINIRVLPTDARTVITISDDGAGMSEETLLHLQEKLRGDAPVPLKRSKGSGIALTNVNRRIKLLFGSDYGLRIMENGLKWPKSLHKVVMGMYKCSNGQISLADFRQPVGMHLKEDNRWVKKAQTIPWLEIEKRYATVSSHRVWPCPRKNPGGFSRILTENDQNSADLKAERALLKRNLRFSTKYSWARDCLEQKSVALYK